jgi:hypothetical protein
MSLAPQSDAQNPAQQQPPGHREQRRNVLAPNRIVSI